MLSSPVVVPGVPRRRLVTFVVLLVSLLSVYLSVLNIIISFFNGVIAIPNLFSVPITILLFWVFYWGTKDT